MIKKSTYAFLAATVLALGTIVYGWIFVSGEIGAAKLTEESISGDRAVAERLVTGFRADSADNLHWITGYDYETSSTSSSFKRGDMKVASVSNVYDDIRFTGWSQEPYYTQLSYKPLDGLQDKKLQRFYSLLQKQFTHDGSTVTGTLRLGDYLDYYPVSFRFQFGGEIYNSSIMLKGLSDFSKDSTLTDEKAADYEGDIELYRKLNDNFRIPVIENEYQEYSVSESKVSFDKPLDNGYDYYEFDPAIVLQQENIIDGVNWRHPDMKKSAADGEASGSNKASDYGLKNRLLFVVNNRTANGKPVDVSQIKDGFGVYELPIDTNAYITIGKGRKNLFIADPKPLTDQLKMLYSLDPSTEYVELCLSDDHRNLALFYIKDDTYCVEIVDADTWESRLTAKMFPATDKMTYAWGEDDTLAATDHDGHIIILTKTGKDATPYKVFFSGAVSDGIDHDLFSSEMTVKKKSYHNHEYGFDSCLAVAADEGKVALVQNSPVGNTGFRNPDLMCVVIDKSGVAYRGLLKSNLVDIDYGITDAEYKKIMELADDPMGENIIRPVGSKNRAAWKNK